MNAAFKRTFGDVRALVAQGNFKSDPVVRRVLVQRLGQAYRLDAECYEAILVPYIKQATDRFEGEAFARASSVDELEWLATLVPQGRFVLRLDADSEVKRLTSSWAYAQVSRIVLNRVSWTVEDATKWLEGADASVLKRVLLFQFESVYSQDQDAASVALIRAMKGFDLVRFDWWSDRTSPLVVRAMLESLSPSLARLMLYGVSLSHDQWREVATCERFVGLKDLNLSECQLTTQTLEEVVSSEILGGLEALSLYSNPRLGPTGLRVLCEHRPERWRRLDLSHTLMNEMGVFGQDQGLEHLEQLQLQYAQLAPSGTLWDVAPLLVSEHLPALRQLNLGFCRGVELTDLLEMMRHFGVSSEMVLGHLEELSLWGCSCDESRLSQYESVDALPALKVLDLSHCQLSVEVVKILAGSLWCQGLERLVLTKDDIPPEVEAWLAKSEFGKKVAWF